MAPVALATTASPLTTAASTIVDGTPATAGASGTGFHPFQATSVAAAKTETAKQSGEAGGNDKGGRRQRWLR